MRVLMLISIALFIFSCQTSKQVVLISSNEKWEFIESEDRSLPVARHEAAFIGIEDNFFLVGGRRNNPTSIFDLKNKTWSQGALLPLELHHFQPINLNGKIYIAGAMTGKYPGEIPVANFYIYHPKEDRWEKGPLIPEHRRRGAAGAIAYQGKIYLVCGIKDGHRGDHKSWLDVYDPLTNTWEELMDAPRARDHFQAVVAGDELYLIGGRTTVAAQGPFRNTIAAIDVYNFKSGKWRTLKQKLPTKRAGTAAINVGDDILIIGGESADQKPAHNEVEAFNIKAQKWRTLSPLNQGRHGTGVIQYKRQIFIASGSGNSGGGPELTTLEQLKIQ